MTSVSAGHIILTPTQPVGSGRPQRGSNPGPPHPESRALPTELHPPKKRSLEAPTLSNFLDLDLQLKMIIQSRIKDFPIE